MQSQLNYNEILNMASQLHTSAGRMEEILNNVKAEFDKIGTDGVWSGDAASQTKAEFDTLAAKFHEFYEAVDSCANYLPKMVENYQAADNAIKGAL